MPHRPRPSLLRLLTRNVLTTLTITTGGTLLALGSGAGPAEVPDRQSGRPVLGQTTLAATPAVRLMKRLDCSTTGFGPDAYPESAIVRGPDGKLRAVSFEQGWAVHTATEVETDTTRHAQQDVLMAVCLRPLR